MSGYLRAAAGTVLIVRVARTKEWHRSQVVGWESLEIDEGQSILGPVVVTGSFAEPWSQQLYPAGENLDVGILSEADDRCVCPTPQSTPEAPLACTGCGRHLRDRWTEAGPG